MKLKIEKLIFEGFGLGRSFVDSQDDKKSIPIFVRKSVPGDELEVEIIKDKKSYKEGVIKKIIKPSEYRVEPPCPYFDECGGCEHQNIDYENQLKFKGEIFEETLSRAGLNIKSNPIIAGSDNPFFYRNSIRFFFVQKTEGISFARHNYLYDKGYVEVESCLLQSETCNEILKKMKELLNSKTTPPAGEAGIRKSELGSLWQLKIREGKFTSELMIEIITSADYLPEQKGIVNTLKDIPGVKSIYHTVAPGKSLKQMKRRLIFGSPIISEKIGKFKFQISPESFFQTNSLGVETLYNVIKKLAKVEVGERILDLFCGTGSIGIYLSTIAKKVIGVEIVPEAVRDAKDNARINNIHNCEFIKSDANNLLASLEIRNSGLEIHDYEIIVLDPPRAGLTKDLINKLSAISEDQRVVYTSCNPATFARDIKEFEKYNIELLEVQPIDMFPQTHHIECVGLLEKRSI